MNNDFDPEKAEALLQMILASNPQSIVRFFKEDRARYVSLLDSCNHVLNSIISEAEQLELKEEEQNRINEVIKLVELEAERIAALEAEDEYVMD